LSETRRGHLDQPVKDYSKFNKFTYWFQTLKQNIMGLLSRLFGYKKKEENINTFTETSGSSNDILLQTNNIQDAPSSGSSLIDTPDYGGGNFGGAGASGGWNSDSNSSNSHDSSDSGSSDSGGGDGGGGDGGGGGGD
jgi:hypothetical protein